MKKCMKRITLLVTSLLLCFSLSACGTNEYVLNENSFFKVMVNMLCFPEQYQNSSIELDCFTYNITDVNGKTYKLGARKCSSSYGCKCGKDTIIGFILVYNGEIPEPVNQSEDTNEKTWIHIRGKLASFEKTSITVYAYNNGAIDENNTETIQFLTFNVESLSLVEDYSNLHYYVS